MLLHILAVLWFVGVITDFFVKMEQQKKRKFKFPLWAKTLAVLLLSVSTVSVVALVYSSRYLRNTTLNHYVDKATELADTLGIYLDYTDVLAVRNKTQEIYEEHEKAGDTFVSNEFWGEEDWVTYYHYYDEVLNMQEYKDLLAQIQTFHEVNNAEYTYLGYADWDNHRLVYLVDDSALCPESEAKDPTNPDYPVIEGERCLPGMFDDFTEQDETIYQHKTTGFEPEITNMEQYGHLVSVGRPIFTPDSEKTENDIQAFALVDLSMDAIIADEDNSVRTLTIILLILGVGSIVIGYLLVVFFLLRPVRKLTKVANEYTSGANEGSDGLDKFAKVKIRTRDEIEDLSNSMKKMEEDINKYISDLLNTSNKLGAAVKKADEMKQLADIDALTGIRNKRSYFEMEERLNEQIKQGKAEFAISMIDLNDLKVTNDTLGHEKGDELIVALSKIINDTFKSSTAYRVGGDEFVVVSENGDLKEIDKLQKKFVSEIINSINHKRINGMGVSAAIGVAIFDPRTDNNVEDTFKRADKKMYLNKKKMKDN